MENHNVDILGFGHILEGIYSQADCWKQFKFVTDFIPNHVMFKEIYNNFKNLCKIVWWIL